MGKEKEVWRKTQTKESIWKLVQNRSSAKIVWNLLMAKKKRITIRYRKPNQSQWVYMVLNEDDVEEMVQHLKEEGYIVER